ncbi:hypothetical protein NHF46_24290 [Arthrobacter alpinus]|nr:hypothetical protein [Arthrobacter alpinus]
MDDRDAVQQMQNELMLLSRYQFRPHPRSAGMLERSAFCCSAGWNWWRR